MTTLYVDLSHHDWDRAKGELDFTAIRQATSPVLCVRATYGDPDGYHPTTRAFAAMQSGAAAAGFTVRGGYHNLVHGDAASMRRQVEWFRSTIGAAGCSWAMVDIERYAELVNNGLWPRWDDVLRFRDAWYAVDSRPLVYYLPRWLWSGYYGNADLRQLHGPLVASDYGANTASAPAPLYASRGGDSGSGWDHYGNVTPSVWQYGSLCQVPGTGGGTDINAFRGSVAQLAALLTGDDMALTTDERAVLDRVDGAVRHIDGRLEAIAMGRDNVADNPAFLGSGSPMWLVPEVAQIAADVAELKARPGATVDVGALAEAVVAALKPDLEAAAEAAVRRVLGAVDGATPQG